MPIRKRVFSALCALFLTAPNVNATMDVIDSEEILFVCRIALSDAHVQKAVEDLIAEGYVWTGENLNVGGDAWIYLLDLIFEKAAKKKSDRLIHLKIDCIIETMTIVYVRTESAATSASKTYYYTEDVYR